MSSEMIIDARTAEDIKARIGALAASYTPEWRFDTQNPDVGSVIALIYAGQMARNIFRLNQVFDKFHTEFVNMLQMSLLPAHPAHGIVVMELIRDTVPGVDLPRGTKLLGQRTDEELSVAPVVFETCADVHITNARLRDILMAAPAEGKLIPVMGSVRKTPLFERDETVSANEEEETVPAFTLFDGTGEGVEQNLLMLYHKSIFDVDGDASLSVRITESGTGRSLSTQLCDPNAYRWSYLSEKGLTPFDSVSERQGAVVLRRNGDSAKTTLQGEDYSVVAVEALQPVREILEIAAPGLSSSCEERPPEFVTHNAEEMETAGFLPFGETASLYDECYIGGDAVFSQQDATVVVCFTLRYAEKLVRLTQQAELEELKVIKPKPRTIPYEIENTSVERVALEYFNGTGWRKLPCTSDVTVLFAGDQSGPRTFSFPCPRDWQPLSIGAHTGRVLRMRITQADNCYLRPCLHRMPVIEDLTLRYAYPEQWKMPHKLHRISGTRRTELTEEMLSGQSFAAFLPLPYVHNELYLGFDRKMNGAPVSMLFDIGQGARFAGDPVGFAYSTSFGFKPLKVIDHTENLSRMGVIVFIPPPDFAETEVEGVRRYWIRLADQNGTFDESGRSKPLIRGIVLNAVEVQNVETLPPESFYIDAVRPNMSFPLAAENILSADVFVNEKNTHTTTEMRRLAEECPNDVRISYGFLGDISEFFVRWTEVDNFDNSKPGDRHYCIDRMTNRIIFGDGISVRAPKAQQGEEAFTVVVKCCRGAEGNLPAGTINASQGRLLHIDNLYNPVATWSGSNIESLEKARMRGANLLCSQNRLVSAADILREVKLYSPAVLKARCVQGRDSEGRLDPRLLSVVVMMRDYKNGAYSFAGIKDGLKAHLLAKSEASFDPDMLVITEPVYVTISVTVFVEAPDAKASFAIRQGIENELTRFLDPSSEGGKWDIGVLPDEAQIRLLLNSLRLSANIRQFMVTARYTDHKGAHECSLASLAGNPFMIGISGTHAVYMKSV